MLKIRTITKKVKQILCWTCGEWRDEHMINNNLTCKVCKMSVNNAL